MSLRLRIVGTLCASLALAFACSSLALAAPRFFTATPTPQATVDTDEGDTTVYGGGSTNSSTTAADPDPILADRGATTVATATVPETLKPAQLPACNKRSNLINAIMVHADTRSNNQIVFFMGTASNVEAFYVKSGKSIPTYSQLVAAINTDQSTAQDDLTTLLSDSTFSCKGSNPPGIVSAYQAGLTTEETDIQNLRDAVKNLIQGVAQAVGYTLPETTGDQQ